MAKEEVGEIKELKNKVLEGKAIIGSDRVVKALQSGKITKVFMANNCPTTTKNNILHYAKLADINVIQLNQDNEELGIICKKNFFIAVVGII